MLLELSSLEQEAIDSGKVSSWDLIFGTLDQDKYPQTAEGVFKKLPGTWKKAYDADMKKVGG